MMFKNAPHHQSSLYPEGLFRSLYTIEQERAELTGKPFLFVSIDISRLDTLEIIRWLMPLEKCLLDISRAYDWKGWYSRGRSIGIIYTESPCMHETLLRQLILDSARPLIGHCRVEEISISIDLVKGPDAMSLTFDRVKTGKLTAV